MLLNITPKIPNMKKTYLISILLLCAILLSGFGITALQAQDYQISFAGFGQRNTVDSVKVINLTQGTSLTINNSQVLHLMEEITGIETKFSEEGRLRIYPNPSGETSKIEFNIEKAGKVDLQIFDVTGKM